jgi:hypothetical protein
MLALSCVPEGEDRDTTPPATPNLKPRSMDSLYAETGIRPEPGTDAASYWIRVEWFPNLEEDLAGYLVYRRGEYEADFPQTALRNLILGQNLSPNIDPYFIDLDWRNLQPDDTSGDSRGYFYAVRAYDQLGNISELSRTAYYRLINNPRNLAVSRKNPGQYYLEWNFESGISVFIDYFMIRVWDEDTGEPMWWMKYIEFSSTHSVLLNLNGSARPFETGHSYVWKLSVIANSNPPTRSPAGSAAKTTFTYSD